METDIKVYGDRQWKGLKDRQWKGFEDRHGSVWKQT